jgi:hypothetical protein
VQGGVVHSLTVGDFRLVLKACLVVLCRLLEGEVVSARDGAQAEERDAELAVAELPPGRGICLVVLVKRVGHFDAPGLEGGKKPFQVIDSVLNLNLTHQAASRSQAWLALQRSGERRWPTRRP